MKNIESIARHLNDGGLAVVPTDTLYGLVGRADKPRAVEEVYELKRRDKNKPLIILISEIEEALNFSVDKEKIVQANENWPGPTSIILPVVKDYEDLEYLHRGTKSLAFRMPNDERILKLIKKTGPIVAPSANPQGKEPARTIEEARGYFSNEVKYLDGGELGGSPSRLISLLEDKPKVLR